MRKILFTLLCLAFSTVLVNAQSKIVPFIEMSSGTLFGGSENGKWLDAKTTVKSLSAETLYKTFYLDSVSGREFRFPKPVDEGAPCEDFYYVDTVDNKKFGVALGGNANWNPVPRVLTAIDTNNPIYKKAVMDVLRAKRIINPKINITKVFRVDLEGDGQDEVIIEATSFKNDITPNAPAGSYSMILMRKVINGKVQNIIVNGDFYVKAVRFAAPGKFELSSIADLNGDGKMEIVIYGSYYEGMWVETYEMLRNKPAVVKILQAGCGV